MLGCLSFASLTFVCRSPTGGFTLTTYPARSSCHRFHVRARPCGQVLRALCSGSISAWFRVRFTLAPLFYRTRLPTSSKRRYFFIWALGTRKEASVGIRYLFALAGSDDCASSSCEGSNNSCKRASNCTYSSPSVDWLLAVCLFHISCA